MTVGEEDEEEEDSNSYRVAKFEEGGGYNPLHAKITTAAAATLFKRDRSNHFLVLGAYVAAVAVLN